MKQSAEDQLAGFIAKFTPVIEARTYAILAAMRKRLPGALQLVYDNYNALAIGFGPTEKASDAIFSIAVFPRWVSLFFLQDGSRLKDPDQILKGKGNVVRHIVLEEAGALNDPRIKALMSQALELAEVPMPKGGGCLVIKSVSAKQRPRRPVEK